MIDMTCRLADDLKKSSYKVEAVCDGVEKSVDISRGLDPISSEYQVI